MGVVGKGGTAASSSSSSAAAKTGAVGAKLAAASKSRFLRSSAILLKRLGSPLLPWSAHRDYCDRLFSRVDRLKDLAHKGLFGYNTGEEVEWEKDDAIDVLYWAKQVIGIAVGIALGFCGIKGWMGYAVMFGILYFGSAGYSNALQIPDDVMTQAEVFQEGLMPAVMTFTFFWTLTNTIMAKPDLALSLGGGVG